MSQQSSLLVHPESEFSKRLERAAEAAGYRVTSVVRVDEAKLALAGQVFDLVVAAEDDTAPDAFASVAHLSRGARTVAVLANHSFSEALRAGKAGAQACVLSSATDPELAAALASPRLSTSEGLAGPERGPAPYLGGNFTLDEIEREHIERVIARSPSFEAAARLLGIDDSTLWRKRKRFASRPPKRTSGPWAA